MAHESWIEVGRAKECQSSLPKIVRDSPALGATGQNVGTKLTLRTGEQQDDWRRAGGVTTHGVSDGQWGTTGLDRPRRGVGIHGCAIEGIQGEPQQNELCRRVRLVRLLWLAG
ncbi:MAG: hypothetical protein MZV65_36880 [Chromatiales bacterium]|nr:hypothetical protein [Chromatiales bacterium]